MKKAEAFRQIVSYAAATSFLVMIFCWGLAALLWVLHSAAAINSFLLGIYIGCFGLACVIGILTQSYLKEDGNDLG